MNSSLRTFAILCGLATALTAATVAPTKALARERTPSDYLAEGWNRAFYKPFASELSNIPHVRASTPNEQAKCEDFYSNVRRNGEMRILLGIGYYDFSEGEPFKFTYRPDGSLGTVDYDFGMNATLDQTIVGVYRELLTSKCHGSLQFCGFDEDRPGVFTKYVRSPDGQRIKAILEMRSPSITTSHTQNVGPLKAQQDALSSDVTSWFFGGIAKADLVVYNGHARKGGGPDFAPPRLLSNKHVNYGWYGKHTPGLNRLVSALEAAPEKPKAILLMACNSTKLFEKQVERAAPGIGYSGMNLVPETGLVPTKGTIAGVDAFLKMQCQSGWNKELSVDSDMRSQLKPLTIK
jgi:hypothetical protein